MKIRLKLEDGYSGSALWGLVDYQRYLEKDEYQFDVIEEGEYEQDHKYQHATHIVKCTKSPIEQEVGRTFFVNDSRSGSYHSDWYYNTEWNKDLTLTECEPKEITIKKWVEVK